MNRKRALLVAVVLLGGVTAFSTTQPFTNIALDDNGSGWFTFDNLDEYGADLDERLDGHGYVFTGHPAYLMASDEAHLLFDMPRIHYFVVTWEGTPVGQRFLANMTAALRDGTAEYAIAGPMTEKILEEYPPAGQAFRENYCIVGDDETRALYNRTRSKLYRYAPEDCPPGQRPTVEYVSED